MQVYVLLMIKIFIIATACMVIIKCMKYQINSLVLIIPYSGRADESDYYNGK